MTSPFDVLGVSPHASSQELRLAFKRKALAEHPDKGGSKEAFQAVVLAFETLSKTIARKLQNAPAAGCKVLRTSNCFSQKDEASQTRGPLHKHQCSEDVKKESCTKPPDVFPTSKGTARRSPSRDRQCGMSQQRVKKNHEDRSTLPNKKLRRTCSENRSHGGTAFPNQHMLGTIFDLLRQLPLLKRRELLQQRFSERQRLALEQWIIARKHISQQVLVPAHILKVVQLPNGSEEDDLPSSESDCSTTSPLALCDKESTEQGALSTCHREIDTDHDLQQLEEHVGVELNECDALESHISLEEEQRCHMGDDGIAQVHNVYGRDMWYRVIVLAGGLRVSSRTVEDLTAALDIVVVLTALRQDLAFNADVKSDIDTIATALESILKEHDTTVQRLGLTFQVPVHIKCWFGPTAHIERYSPPYNDVRQALRTWRRLNQFDYHRYWNKRGFRRDRALDHWMRSYHTEWPGLRKVYLDVLAEAGNCPEQSAARLHAQEDATVSHRERLMELWNLKAMAKEERHRKKSDFRKVSENIRMAAEDQRQRKAVAFEHRSTIWNRKKMAREERRQLRVQRIEWRRERWNQKATLREDRRSAAWRKSLAASEAALEAKLCRLLSSWQRADIKEAKAAAKANAFELRSLNIENQRRKKRIRLDALQARRTQRELRAKWKIRRLFANR